MRHVDEQQPLVDEGLVRLFLEVAAIEGLSGHERGIADHVLRFAHDRGFAATEQSLPDNSTGNVLVQVGEGGERMLTAHLDTVRSTAALVPVRLADRLRSDGTTVLGVDNRAGVAVLLWTLDRIARGELDPAPCTLAFTVREESDLGGSRQLAWPDTVRMAFVLDSSLAPGAYIHRAPGALDFSAELAGRPAHAGIHPEQGRDAVQALMRALARLPWGRLDAETTANVGRVEGGEARNTVPALARAEGEVRSTRVSTVKKRIGAIERALDDACHELGVELRWDCRWGFEPFALPLDAPVCQAAEAALRGAGLTPKPVASSGGSDANALNARGLPAINFGIGARNPHANEEEILLEDLAATARLAGCLVAPERRGRSTVRRTCSQQHK